MVVSKNRGKRTFRNLEFLNKDNKNCSISIIHENLVVARFAALHQKLAEKQPTLQEVDANVKRKFAEHEKAVPGIFKVSLYF